MEFVLYCQFCIDWTVLDRVRGVSAKAGAGEEGYASAATVS
jgi:hypothetical protein